MPEMWSPTNTRLYLPGIFLGTPLVIDIGFGPYVLENSRAKIFKAEEQSRK